jgi:hypothetical protein
MAESGVDTYVLAARPRDRLEAKIGGFPDRTLALRVTRVNEAAIIVSRSFARRPSASRRSFRIC